MCIERDDGCTVPGFILTHRAHRGVRAGSPPQRSGQDKKLYGFTPNISIRACISFTYTFDMCPAVLISLIVWLCRALTLRHTLSTLAMGTADDRRRVGCAACTQRPPPCSTGTWTGKSKGTTQLDILRNQRSEPVSEKETVQLAVPETLSSGITPSLFETKA